MTRYEHYKKIAMELNRDDCGKVVQVLGEGWSVVGTLHRVDNKDVIDIDGFDFSAGGRRTIQCWLTVGPWYGEVDPRIEIIIEEDQLALGKVSPNQLRAEAGLPELEILDVIEGAIVYE